MSDKGVVIEREKGHVVLLTSDGRFLRVPYKGVAAVGEEISVKKARSRKYWWSVPAAAALLLLITGLHMFMPVPVYALIAIDINPSVELGIDRDAFLLQWASLDEEGKHLTSKLSKGLYLDEAIGLILEDAVRLNYLDPLSGENMVLASLMGEETEDFDLDHLERHLEEAMVRQQLAGIVGLAVTSKDLRDEARQLGMSPNRVILWKAAEEIGNEVSVSDLQGPVGHVMKQLGIPPGHAFREYPVLHPGNKPPDVEDKGAQGGAPAASHGSESSGKPGVGKGR